LGCKISSQKPCHQTAENKEEYLVKNETHIFMAQKLGISTIYMAKGFMSAQNTS
jgi:hypothetical protein